MLKPTKEIGEVSVYGTWDDVTDNQFLVLWGEAGPTCTAITLSGYDYGGGVQQGSSNVPVKELEDLINSDEYIGNIKRKVAELIAKYP